MRFLDSVSSALFGPVAIMLLVFAGVYFTLSGSFFQIRGFKLIVSRTIGSFFSKEKSDVDKKSLTPVQSALSALSATIGTGSMAGVAAAICIGGAGAVFWMWVSAFLSMMTAYAEGVLTIKYRRLNNGEYEGSAMSYIKRVLGNKMAKLYAFFLLGACIGMGGMAQSRAAVASAQYAFGINEIISAVIIALIGFAAALTGTKRLGRLSQSLVPLMSLLYLVGGSVVLIKFHHNIIPSLRRIISEALGLRQCAGGVVGGIIIGCRRGVFSTEAGLGTTASIHSKSSCSEPCEQGMWGIFEVFVDTFVISTLTALTVLVTNADYHTADGAQALLAAFELGMGKAGGIICAISTILFALATICGFTTIGKTAFSYLVRMPFTNESYGLLLAVALYFASLCDLNAALSISDIFNGLMLIPNLCALLLLSPVVKSETRGYLKARQKRGV